MAREIAWRRKELFYLRTHSTHFLWDHSESETKLIAATTWATLGQQVILYMHHPTDRIAHTTTFVTPVVEYWLEREIAEGVHHEETL